MSLPKVTYCMVHWNRLRELQKAVRQHSPHVDRTIIVDGDSTDGSLTWLGSDECKELKVDTYVHPWVDDPPGQRNRYLDYAGHDGWVLVTDCDEYLEESGIWSIKQIAAEAEKNNVTLIGFRSHDIQTSDTGSVWENCSNYWNPMFFKMGHGVRYSGHTHVGLNVLPGKRLEAPYRYFHIKSVPDQWLRGARNYWTTAATAQNVHNDVWREFRALCSSYELSYFYQLAELMRDGEVPQNLVEWFINHKEDENAEMRSYFITYLVFMHPELNPGLSNRDFTYSQDRIPIRNMSF